MFLKKDLRKISEIVSDKDDQRETLNLSKRSFEFQGNLQVLFPGSNNTFSSPYENLRILNLYDNDLSSLVGIGALSQTPLEEINLGCNKLSSLPSEFGTLRNLRTLWLDDNNFNEFPSSICQLKELSALRFSGNHLKVIPTFISTLLNLETMAFDNNEIEEFPSGCLKMSHLKHLWLRQNKISVLPESINGMTSLVTFSISSNKLVEIPENICSMESLHFIYANGNKITEVPEDICLLPNLRVLNLANNLLTQIPPRWLDVFGTVDSASVSVEKKSLILLGNPLQSLTNQPKNAIV